MRLFLGLFFLSALSFALGGQPTDSAPLAITNLRTEYVVNPLAVDTPRPRVAWTLTGVGRARRQTAYQIVVTRSPVVPTEARDVLWDSGVVHSTETFGIEYAGPALQSMERYEWKARVWDEAGRASAWSAVAWWQMGLLRAEDWMAKWIGTGIDDGSVRLRREFQVRRPVARATAYAFGFGWYRLRINGADADNRVLAPLNSNYQKALFYDTYDVTALLRPGGNAVGVVLGAGYNKNYSKYGFRWLGALAMRVQIEIRYTDGTSERIGSDERWRAGDSPVVANHIYDGETYDARREQRGWDAPGFKDDAWRPVAIIPVTAGPLRATQLPPLRVVAKRHAVAVRQPTPGVYVFDFGQNLAGWTRLRVRGAAGTRVTLRHAEDVAPDGNLDTTTNRRAKATDTYILNGSGLETYEQRFTYHGFRYVEMTGFPGTPPADALEACVVHAGLEDAGVFTCSDPLVNRIHENFRWSLWNNLVGIPTDTATRDQRTPCQMDSLAVEETAMHNFWMQPYYVKWLHDISGDYGAAPNWAGDQIVLPMLLYQAYGDRRIVEQQFPAMCRGLDAFTAQAGAQKPWADGFGDWAPPGQPGSYEGSFSEGEIVNTAWYYRAAGLTAEAADIVGDREAARRYSSLAASIRDRFLTRHFRADSNTFGSGRQVTSILPLAFDLLPAGGRAAVAEALNARVNDVDGAHIGAGIFGTRYLFDVLIDAGHADTAWRVLTSKTAPGYGHQIGLGATTCWEQWAFRGSMQTHDHAMFAGPGATFYTRFAGIRPDAPGYRRIVIRPAIPAELSKVTCTLRTSVGTVESSWENRERYVHRVVVPANASAVVYVPAADPSLITEGNRPTADAPGVQFLRTEAGWSVFGVGSGEYHFSAPHAAAR